MNRKQLTIEAELTLEELRFAEDLRGIVRSNLQKVYSAINFGQVNTNWNIGRRIVEEEQHGQTRAEYGKRVIAIASQALTEEFGKGYSQTNCKSYRKFYIEFQKLAIGQTLSAQFENELELLPWSHYERLMQVTDKAARIWYMHEAAKEIWSFRTLNRNINTQYYERMLLSQMSDEVKNEIMQNTAHCLSVPNSEQCSYRFPNRAQYQLWDCHHYLAEVHHIFSHTYPSALHLERSLCLTLGK